MKRLYSNSNDCYDVIVICAQSTFYYQERSFRISRKSSRNVPTLSLCLFLYNYGLEAGRSQISAVREERRYLERRRRTYRSIFILDLSHMNTGKCGDDIYSVSIKMFGSKELKYICGSSKQSHTTYISVQSHTTYISVQP